MADLLVFTGNCQAQYLAAIFDGLNGASAVFAGVGFGFVPNFGPKLARNLVGSRLTQVVADARRRGDRVILVQQVTSTVDDAEAEFIPDVICTFPHVSMHAISPAEFCTFYKLDEAPPPTRILDLDFGSMLRSQRRASFAVDVADYVQRHYRRENLFNTPTHPSGSIGAVLTEGILRQLKALDPAYADPGLVDAVRRNEGINFVTSLPLPTEVVDELQLDWNEQDKLLVTILTHAENGDLDTNVAADLIAMNRDLFCDNTQFWVTAAKVYRARGETGPFIDALRRTVELSPGWLHFWTALSGALLEAGDLEAFERVPSEIKASYGDRMDGDYVLSALHLAAGRHQESLDAGLAYFEASRCWVQAMTYVGAALIHLGRADEVAAYAEKSRRAHSDKASELDAIIAVYAHHLPSTTPAQASG